MTTRLDLENRIWTTERSRIGAEERLNFYEFIGRLATTWYSVLLVVLSIYQNALRARFNVIDETSIALSVIVLTFTIAVSGLRFGQRADLFKSSYHELQRLRADLAGAKDSELQALEKKYIDILDGSPNHSSRDHNRVIVRRWLERRGKEDYPRKPSKYEILVFFLRWLGGWIFIVTLFGLPIAILIWFYFVC